MSDEQKSVYENPFNAKVSRLDLAWARLQDAGSTMFYILACAWLMRELF